MSIQDPAYLDHIKREREYSLMMKEIKELAYEKLGIQLTDKQAIAYMQKMHKEGEIDVPSLIPQESKLN